MIATKALLPTLILLLYFSPWSMTLVQQLCSSVSSVIQFLLWALIYRKITSSNTSRLEAHVGFFRLLMKGIFGPYVL